MPKEFNHHKEIKKALIQNEKSLKEQVSYIRYTRNMKVPQIWRANPSDPYIYFSFSSKVLNTTYGEDPIVQTIFQENSLSDFKKEVVKEFRKITREEWIEKAKLPVKFLSGNESIEDIRSKNICFVLNRNLSSEEQANAFGEVLNDKTLPLRFPLDENDHTSPCEYKIIILNPITKQSKHHGYRFRHESGHVFELKHFKKYVIADKVPYCEPPHCELICHDTVMATEQDCPPVKEKYKEVKARESSKRRYLSPSDKQNLADEVYNEYPDKLGHLDLLAAEEFKQDWETRNREASHQLNKLEPKNLPIPDYLNSGVHEDLLVSNINKLFEYFDLCLNRLTIGMAEYAKGVVSECPSYFLDQKYWSNQTYGSMFRSTNYTNDATPAIGNFPLNTLGSP